MIMGVLYAILATPIYRTDVVLSPVRADRGTMLPSALSGLAALSGLGFGQPRDTTQAIAILRSRVFVEQFIESNHLLPILFADEWDAEGQRWITDDPEEWPDIRDGVEFFIENVRSIVEEVDTGLVTLSIAWPDAEMAAFWAEDMILRINERLRTRDLEESRRRLVYLNEQLEKEGLVELRQAIASLIEEQIENIMLAQAVDEYAFRVIDPPRVAHKPVSPRRVLIILLAGFLGVVVGCLMALVAHRVSLPGSKMPSP
jgi:uncharacterized protein involved in exopolysaccharide biosynthesis